jgi:hypothetical protein
LRNGRPTIIAGNSPSVERRIVTNIKRIRICRHYIGDAIFSHSFLPDLPPPLDHAPALIAHHVHDRAPGRRQRLYRPSLDLGLYARDMGDRKHRMLHDRFRQKRRHAYKHGGDHDK